MTFHQIRRMLCSLTLGRSWSTTTSPLLLYRILHKYTVTANSRLCSTWEFSRSSNKCSSIHTLNSQFGKLLSPANTVSHVQPLDFRSVVELTIFRSISRAINIALKKRPKKVSIPRTLRLIDDEGNNLGIMGSDIALKLAESKNLKLVEVKKATPETEPVYRLFTSKQQWDEAKKKKKAAKSAPINTVKDLTIFSGIGEHDLAVKMSHLREFLERGNSARVFVQTKYRRGINEAKEEESRKALVEMIVSDLEGLGEKVSENPHQRRGIVCQFRPIK